MAPRLAPFPFVVGCERSGTTLLRAMLDAHPELAIPYDSYFLLAMGRRPSTYEVDGRVDVGQFVDHLFQHWQVRRWGLAAEEVREDLRARPPRSFSDAARRVFALYAARQDKPRYGDKTPSYVAYLPLLSELFPEARFVHVVRDGRDVALSWLDVDWGPGTLAQAAVLWAAAVDSACRAGCWLGPARYHELRYEALVHDPEEALRPLCRFLDLDYDDRMLGYFERAEAVVGSDPKPQHHQRLFLPPTPGLRDWRSQMAPDDVAVFESLAGPTLDQLGYRLATGAHAAAPTVPDDR